MILNGARMTVSWRRDRLKANEKNPDEKCRMFDLIFTSSLSRVKMLLGMELIKSVQFSRYRSYLYDLSFEDNEIGLFTWEANISHILLSCMQPNLVTSSIATINPFDYFGMWFKIKKEGTEIAEKKKKKKKNKLPQSA